MATRNQGDNKETTALERVRRNRWVTRVEKTADLLLSLLEDAPKLGYRKPHFPLELESKLKEFLYGVETPGTIGLVDPPDTATYPEVAVEVEAGDVLVHHANVIHRTGPNRTAKHRRNLGFIYHGAAAVRDLQAHAEFERQVSW